MLTSNFWNGFYFEIVDALEVLSLSLEKPVEFEEFRIILGFYCHLKNKVEKYKNSAEF